MSNIYWKKFRADPYYLLRYLGAQTILMTVLYSIFEQYNLSQMKLSPLLAVPIAVIIGIKLPSIMHNAVHGNLSFGNRLIGELTSQIILVSFGVVSINHTFHHAYPDTSKDPHSPKDKSFLLYFLTCLHSGVSVIRKAYLGFHGETKRNRIFFALSTIIHFLSLPAKLFLWYKLLGFSLFISVYLIAFLSFSFTFAHVNYATHAKNEDGKIQTINLNENLWHKFINFIGDGIYYHHNHHLNPKLYNPQKSSLETECNPIGEALKRISTFS